MVAGRWRYAQVDTTQATQEPDTRRSAHLCAIVATSFILVSQQAWAGQTTAAVAANFNDAAKETAAAFKAKTGHDAVLSFGSSGQLYTQSTQDAPFEVFLSADDERPKEAVADGLGAPGSVFTDAIGKLVLWSKGAGDREAAAGDIASRPARSRARS